MHLLKIVHVAFIIITQEAARDLSSQKLTMLYKPLRGYNLFEVLFKEVMRFYASKQVYIINCCKFFKHIYLSSFFFFWLPKTDTAHKDCNKTVKISSPANIFLQFFGWEWLCWKVLWSNDPGIWAQINKMRICEYVPSDDIKWNRIFNHE